VIAPRRDLIERPDRLDEEGAILKRIAAAAAGRRQPDPHRLGPFDQRLDLGQLAQGERL
jgi:hypothetical protein